MTTIIARPVNISFNEKLESSISIEEFSDDDKEATKTVEQNASRLLSHSRSFTTLVSSPYSDLVNQLNLSTLDGPSRLFALALTALTPIRPDYATAPYLESFNWDRIFALLRSLFKQSGHIWHAQTFYVVVFRSKLLSDIDRDRLGLLDQKAHEEACASGGLLKYWFGSTDDERRNLATCLWRKYDDAVAGGKGPWHAQARLAARSMYQSITFHTHLLHINDDATRWSLSDFDRSKA